MLEVKKEENKYLHLELDENKKVTIKASEGMKQEELIYLITISFNVINKVMNTPFLLEAIIHANSFSLEIADIENAEETTK